MVFLTRLSVALLLACFVTMQRVNFAAAAPTASQADADNVCPPSTKNKYLCTNDAGNYMQLFKCADVTAGVAVQGRAPTCPGGGGDACSFENAGIDGGGG